MSGDPLLPHVRTLLSERIETVAQLDLLLFLFRRRERAWTGAQAAAELRIGADWTSEQLARLADRGFLAREAGGFRYGAAPDLGRAVEDLARAYEVFPVSVVAAIYAAPVRPDLRSFSDAFRIRREPGSQEPPRG